MGENCLHVPAVEICLYIQLEKLDWYTPAVEHCIDIPAVEDCLNKPTPEESSRAISCKNIQGWLLGWQGLLMGHSSHSNSDALQICSSRRMCQHANKCETSSASSTSPPGSCPLCHHLHGLLKGLPRSALTRLDRHSLFLGLLSPPPR